LICLATGAVLAQAFDDSFVFVDDTQVTQASAESGTLVIVEDSGEPVEALAEDSDALQKKATPLKGGARSTALSKSSGSPSPLDPGVQLQQPRPIASQPTQPASRPRISEPAPLSEIDQLLVDAHAASSTAATETDYSQIAEKCTSALQLGLEGERKQFALHLISWALNRRGQIYAAAGSPELAESDFQEALHFDANNWRALHNRGVSHAETGDFAEAFDDFNRVIELNPKYAKAYTNRATLYVQAGDLASASEDYEAACRLDARLASARLGLARVCHLRSQYEDALQHFTTAAQLDPDNAGLLCSRGDLYADLGRYGKAMSDYASAIEVDPDCAHAYRNGAWLLATCPVDEYRDTENALLGAQQVLKYEYGERHVALDTLAAAQANAGEFDKAVTTLEEAIELAPSLIRPEYVARIKLYKSGRPFRTTPVAQVSQANYVAE
jgi:tetratricopeptide (TPR) repeat protein